jgi:hypothetical protein
MKMEAFIKETIGMMKDMDLAFSSLVMALFTRVNLEIIN